MATHCLNTKPKQTFTSNQSHSANQLLIINVLVVDYLYGYESLFFEHEPMDMLGSSTFALHESRKE